MNSSRSHAIFTIHIESRSTIEQSEKIITSKRVVSQAPVVDMSEDDINKAVKFVEASTRKKVKPKKI